MTDKEKHGIGLAINEAKLLGVEVDTEKRVAGITLEVLTLSEKGPSPTDSRVLIVLHNVGRVVASKRMGHWDDDKAEVAKFEIRELLSVVKELGGLPIYGWDFIDVHEKDLKEWSDRLSFDWRKGPGGLKHTLSLFQEGWEEHLDIILWFDELFILSPKGYNISIEYFIAGGERWWDALQKGDERTDGKGIGRMNKGISTKDIEEKLEELLEENENS